jgi:hypothetical protein
MIAKRNEACEPHLPHEKVRSDVPSKCPEFGECTTKYSSNEERILGENPSAQTGRAMRR